MMSKSISGDVVIVIVDETCPILIQMSVLDAYGDDSSSRWAVWIMNWFGRVLAQEVLAHPTVDNPCLPGRSLC